MIAERAADTAFAADCRTRASAVKESFAKLFWNPATHSLFDVIGPDGRPDASLRPNQIFAVSLPFPVLDGEPAKSVVEVVTEHLLTPYGLRTLAPGSPDYHPRYAPGDQTARDGAYHQGTVWPWLLSAFAEAHLKVYGDKAGTRALLTTLLGPGLTEYGVGSLAEIYDGDPPHAPNGCPAQAWSVADILRAYALVS